MEFHPDFFLEHKTKETLFKEHYHRGLYPLPSSSSIKHAFSTSRPSLSQWHERLGRPSSPIVTLLVRSLVIIIYLVQVSRVLKQYAMLVNKQKRTSFLPKSTSESRASLDLIFSDVWGPTLEFVGRKQYYVSFIDDYKFVWIYLIKLNLNDSKNPMIFKTL
jgi:hypothetical protein